jgi:uncharacterized protein YbcV (DUF1398 family)
MNTPIETVISECAEASSEGRIRFGEVVARLTEIGVERYQVDFVRRDTTYYLPDGYCEVVPFHQNGGVPAETFTGSGVEAAVRRAQAGTINYQTFCELALAAGCVGYIVSMAGKRVVYYGRTGDSHVEWFPKKGN